MLDDRLDSVLDKWLRNFQKSVKLNTPEINDDWMRDLACHLCDDCPFGYETSHRLASYIFAYLNSKSKDTSVSDNELTLQNILDACKCVGYDPEKTTIYTFDRDSDRKVTVLSNRELGTQLMFDIFPNSVIMTRMSDTSCHSVEFKNFISLADWWKNDQSSTGNSKNNGEM